MKLKEYIAEKHYSILRELINYSFEEIDSYKYLTKKEKEIISEEEFYELFEE